MAISIPLIIEGKQPGMSCGGVKQGRFVILRFPDTGKETARKVSLSPPFCAPQMLVKTRT